MNMKALIEYENPHTLAFMAGADIILHPEDPYAAMKEIKKAYEWGFINDKMISQANKRISKIREKIKKFFSNKFSMPYQDEIRAEEYLLLIHRAFKKTVTVIKNEIEDFRSYKIIPYLAGAYTDEIKNIFQNYFGFAYDLEDYRPSREIPLIAAFTNIKAAGIEYLLRGQQNLLIREIVSNDEAIVVSFGSPYVLSPFKKAKAIISVYDSCELAVLAFLDAFNEGFKNTGRLPVNIEWFDD